MNFGSLLFLYIFLPLTLVAYFAMPDVRRKNKVLVVVSFLLYGMGRPLYLILLAGLSLVNFSYGMRIRPNRRHTLHLPLAVNLAVLLLLGYLDAILGIIGIGSESGGFLLGIVKKMVSLLNEIGMNLTEPVRLMPVGLPFYFLTVVSYFLDIYHGKSKPERDLLNFLTAVTLFPKLAQGPIVRYDQVCRQVAARKAHPRMIFDGAVRFATGLAKKVLIADYCARVISGLSGGPDQTLVGAWLCALLYMYRIYFDFSGFCDMAIGLGKVFGFRFPENFDYPYAAVSVTEFSEKWNLTLRSFVQEYVYIPLGGNRSGQIRQVVNCLIAWLFVGIWHGAGLNYIVWALYLFMIVTVEKLLESQIVDLPRFLRRFLTMLALLFGWVFFAHSDLMELGGALKGMLGFGGFSAPGVGRKVLNCIPLIILCMAASGPAGKQLSRFWANLCNMGGKSGKSDRILATRVVYLASAFGYICLLLWLCTVSLAGCGSVPSVFGW